jgi:uncharacterized membrane protein
VSAANASLSNPAATAFVTPRIQAVDMARGLALLAMAIYHFSWDLSFLELAAIPVMSDPGWKWFARIIAGSFLFLVGIGLVLAHGEGVRWRSFLKRLGVISAAAAGVTFATYLAFPLAYIYFGILHCIALSSVLALPFLRLPWWTALAAAAAVLAIAELGPNDIFNRWALLWTGLGTRVPFSNDYVPIFPWFAPVLAGIGAARLTAPLLRESTLARWRPHGPIGRALTFAGRHSLAVYLLHQPLLLAVLAPVAWIVRG